MEDTVTMEPNHHLPNELWLQIISHLAVELNPATPHGSRLENYKLPPAYDLAALRLANRNLCSLATPCLFRDIELDFSCRYNSPDPSSPSASPGLIRQIPKLLSPDSNQSTEFLSHAVNLRISVIYDVSPDLPFTFFAKNYLQRLLDAMPKLKTVSVVANTHYVAADAADDAVGILGKRDGVDVEYEIRSFTATAVRTFPRVPNLTALTLRSYGDVGDAVTQAFWSSPGLRTLGLQHVSTPMDMILDRFMPFEHVLNLETLSIEYCTPPMRVENIVKMGRLREVIFRGGSHFLAGNEPLNERNFWRALAATGKALEIIESVDWSDELLDYISQYNVRRKIKKLRLPLNRRLHAIYEGIREDREGSLGVRFWENVLPLVQSSLEELCLIPLQDFDGEFNVEHWRVHRELQLPAPWDFLRETLPHITSASLRRMELFLHYEEGFFSKFMDVITACTAIEEARVIVFRNLTQRASPQAMLIPDDTRMFESALREVLRWRGCMGIPSACEMKLRMFSFYNRRQEYWRFRYDKAQSRWRKVKMWRLK